MTANIDRTRRQVLGGAALTTMGLLACNGARAAMSNGQSGKVQLDGIGVYYELHGATLDSQTVPLVLLHGGAVTIEKAFSPELIARFARRRPVIAIEQQGHGHTPDRPDAPFTVERMVQDTAGVLAHLKVRQADLLGHSLGGMIAIGMAIRHPDVVRSVIPLGAPYQLEGFRADLVRLQREPGYAPPPELVKLLPTDADFAQWRASFQRSAPDPQSYDRILERLNSMLAAWQGWSEQDMRRIRASMLVVIGDNDFVRVEHAAEMARLVPNARLAVLPGTTHLNVVKRDAWLEPMIEALSSPNL